MAQAEDSGKLILFSLDGAEPPKNVVDALENISGYSYVKRVVGLIDVHLKAKMEAPSSMGVATEGVYVPTFTSCSLNCGMGALVTTLTGSDVDEKLLDRFFAEIRWRNRKATIRPDVTAEDMRQVFIRGPEAIAREYALPDGFWERCELGGKHELSEDEVKNLDRAVPKWIYETARFGFPNVPAGNHFIEVQIADDLLELDECAQAGLRKGSVVVMYHAGSMRPGDILNRLYAVRTKHMKAEANPVYHLQKFLFHFLACRSIECAKRRWDYYYDTRKFITIPVDSDEGRRLATAVKVTDNYTYALRMGVAAHIRDALKAARGDDVGLSLFYDQSHNSMRIEESDGESLVFHRHNANCVRPGQPLVLPGFYNTCSYLGIGAEGAAASMFTIDHGLAAAIEREVKARGLVAADDAPETVLYGYNGPNKRRVRHLPHSATEPIVTRLAELKMAKPIVRLRPIATFKSFDSIPFEKRVKRIWRERILGRFGDA
jgi:tRNA-splicing ligase RtcB